MLPQITSHPTPSNPLLPQFISPPTLNLLLPTVAPVYITSYSLQHPVIPVYITPYPTPPATHCCPSLHHTLLPPTPCYPSLYHPYPTPPATPCYPSLHHPLPYPITLLLSGMRGSAVLTRLFDYNECGSKFSSCGEISIEEAFETSSDSAALLCDIR